MEAERSALDEAVEFFNPGERARMCGDGARADSYHAARAELRALRARVAELEAALSDAIQSVESAPERCAGASMLRTPQIGSRQIAAWKAALTPKDPRP